MAGRRSRLKNHVLFDGGFKSQVMPSSAYLLRFGL